MSTDNNTVHNLSLDMAPCCHVLTLACVFWQRSQVTSLFGAERLWGRGFTGKKVKMAIFDTGIRADHPHFRNIKVLLLYLAILLLVIRISNACIRRSENHKIWKAMNGSLKKCIPLVFNNIHNTIPLFGVIALRFSCTVVLYLFHWWLIHVKWSCIDVLEIWE